MKTQDEVFVDQALNLASLAARAIEEGEQYIEMIGDEKLRRKTEDEFDKRLNT